MNGESPIMESVISPGEPPEVIGTVEATEDETLDALLIRMEVILSAHLDARFRTIEAQNVRIIEFISQCETLVKAIEEMPLFQSMMQGDSPFPFFPGK